MAGKIGNSNAQTHGLYGYLAIGSLPKGCSYIRKMIGRFEGVLRDAIVDKYGQIGVYRAALVQSCCRHEGRAQLLGRWLRHEDGDLKVMDKVGILREIGAASDSRDKCLRLLGLDNDDRDVIDGLYENIPTNGPTRPIRATTDEETVNVPNGTEAVKNPDLRSPNERQKDEQ